jgi:two-component system OmpR family sensor kinase
MSSNRPSRSWSLRSKLIAEQVTLLAAVCLIIGLLSMLFLHGFLVKQLDDQLHNAAERAVNSRGHGPPPLAGGPRETLKLPGFGPGTFLGMITNGEVVDAQRLSPGEAAEEQLPPGQRDVLAQIPVDKTPHNMTLGDLGEYRVIAARTPAGDVMITGLPLTPVSDIMLNFGFILGGVALVGLLAAGLAGALIIRRTLHPLQRVAAIAGRVSELPLHQGEVALAVRVPEQDSDPNTEVGQVGVALNRMLGHIGNALNARQASETRVRQFVADASHELRTPLAAIRGYAELTRRSRADVPPEIAHAMSRVESEADRMTSLVQDLLLLARLDAGRPLEFDRVDLTRVVLDAVSDARIAGGEHNWQLELPAEPVTVTGDADRLHQVLTNLLSNARTHTPPGTTVTVGLTVAANAVELTVTDDGPGIPPALLPDVFERFARGDSSRSRAAGSTGLGLSIVAAVVAAHHGTVEVRSEPGKTRFEVRLRT